MQGQGLATALGGGAGFSGGTFVAPNYSLGSQSFTNVGSALSYLYSLDGGTPTPPAGGGGSSTDPNAVHYDNAAKGTITLGGADGTTISNVAPGAVSATSTEAINGGQLYASQQAGQAYTNQQVQAGINQSENWAKSYTDAKFDQLNDRFNNVAAIGQASASMAGNYRNTSNSVAAGLGNSGGRNALAVGYRHVSDDGRFSWSIQGAIAGSERSIGVGAGFGW
jgi:autotransporter adhesin